MWAGNQIPTEDQAKFVRDARDYALVNGLVLRYDDLTNDNCVGHIPFTLLPSPFPRKLYQECLDIQPAVNKLMLKIANDFQFIDETLRPIGEVDPFTKALLDINHRVMLEGLAQPVISCINRADYMLDKTSISSQNQLRVRQVEMNAIASSMPSHSCSVSKLHKFLMVKYALKIPDGSSLPENNAVTLVATGIIDAYDIYGKSASVVLLITEMPCMNFSDQFMIELEVHRLRPNIKFVRKAFHSLTDHVVRLGPNRELMLEGAEEVAVVYFRNCYDPSNYDFDGSWDLRLLLERSKAIKCPSINFHLSGAKKFQQVLSSQVQLEKYLESREAERLAALSCRFWSFEDPDEGMKAATDNALRLVLKPQREGGGHNIYGEDIQPFVKKIVQTNQKSQYILMEYIDAPAEKNWLLLHGDEAHRDHVLMRECDQLVSELGIFGSILADTKTSAIHSNRSAGYLVRSKRRGVNEGGVARGYAGISNLILLDDDHEAYNQSLYCDD